VRRYIKSFLVGVKASFDLIGSINPNFNRMKSNASGALSPMQDQEKRYSA